MISISSFLVLGPVDKGIKRLNPHGFQDDKIPPKSPRPRRSIWLSRSQSDIFARKSVRKVNVQDPYYNPGPRGFVYEVPKVNPFSAREDLKGGKIKFYDMPSKSVFSFMFDLHSPQGSQSSYQPQPNTGTGATGINSSASWSDPWQLPGRQCRSLPVSPRLPYSEAIFSSHTAPKSELGQAGADGRQRALSGWAKKYAITEIPPYRPRSEGEEVGTLESWSSLVPSDSAEAEAMDCSSSRGSPADESERIFSQMQNGSIGGLGEEMEAEDQEDVLIPNKNSLTLSMSVEPHRPIVLTACKASTATDRISRCDI